MEIARAEFGKEGGRGSKLKRAGRNKRWIPLGKEGGNTKQRLYVTVRFSIREASRQTMASVKQKREEDGRERERNR